MAIPARPAVQANGDHVRKQRQRAQKNPKAIHEKPSLAKHGVKPNPQ